MVGINTNLSALNARQSLEMNAVNQSSAMQQLSTGLRINSAKDDAAGLAIATKMTSNIKGVAVAVRNANDGISMAQTAESALGSVTNMLQRMRELAVQASNGTLSSSNRASIQLEVTQLTSEIDNISKTANFNGIKLFDGGVSAVSLQTNVNAGDVVKMSIGAMSSSRLGAKGDTAVISSQGIDATSVNGTTAAVSVNSLNKGLSAGDLVINGISVGSSLGSDDTLSAFDRDSSAVSKAAAINKVSGQTGVVATVGPTVALGQTMTLATSAGTAAGTFTINGVTTDVFTLKGKNAGEDRSIVVAAINAITGATGVRAVDNGSDSTGVSLIADDGRNITAFTTAVTGSVYVAANSGVNAVIVTTAAAKVLYSAGAVVSTFTGSINLTSTTSSPITISTGNSTTQDFTRTGFQLGTFAAGQATLATLGRASTTGSANAVALKAGDLMINGIAIQGSLDSDDTVSNGNSEAATKAASAISIAAAVNKSSAQTGVRAVANATVFQGSGWTSPPTTSTAGNVYINGIQIGITIAATSKQIDIVNQINSYSKQTGVVASDNGAGMNLVAADGRNITISFSGGAAALSAATLGLTANTYMGSISQADPTAGSANSGTTYYGSISFVSDKAFTLQQGFDTNAGSHLKSLGIQAGSYGGSTSATKLGSVDLSSLDGANSALNIIDTALSQISDQRSNLGAIQNRLQSAVDNLTSSSTNLQAAQGRIQDTDYSTTTTQMSKSQIIAQAATAMLAQANQQPQMVLSLLK
jgi:flagellin